jgi:branched-chain amino acid transport system ATP-binding protein
VIAESGHHEALLRVDGVGVSFQGVKALENVSFDVERGGVTSVIGPNGAGKTTLFNCITGLYDYEGHISLAGQPLDRMAAHARVAAGISRTFQTPALLEDATVLDNVLLGAHARTVAGFWRCAARTPLARREEWAARGRAEEILERLGLGDEGDALVDSLPHPRRRLVEAGRALVAEPTLLLLDEPAAGSTHAEALAMLGAIIEAAGAADTTIVLIEHNVPLVMEISRRVVVLNFGQLICEGTPEVVRDDERVTEAYLGTAA